MYHSITYGKGLMGSHASQINQMERWQVIQYVQVLQKGGSMPEFDENGNVVEGSGEAEASMPKRHLLTNLPPKQQCNSIATNLLYLQSDGI